MTLCKLPHDNNDNNDYELNNYKDISKEIFVFVHVDKPKLYQLMHIEVQNLDTLFHIYGKFDGNPRKDKNEFDITKIEFKIIMMNNDEDSQRVIDFVKVSKYPTNPCKVDVTIHTRIEKGGENFKILDFSDKPFKLYKNQLLDNHVDHEVNRNGRICMNYVHFDN